MKEIQFSKLTGVRVGHAQNIEGGTGCTVVLCKEGATAGVDVRGGAPATRETDLLSPVNTVERIHAVMLSGGSAYGLDACSGAMRYLEEQGIGFDMQVAVVPIVCGASLFDLMVGDPKCRPNAEMGYQACLQATSQPAEGNIGAGTGATVGKLLGPERTMKSGFGVYALQAGDLQVAATIAVNAVGDVVDPKSGRILAGLLNESRTQPTSTEQALLDGAGLLPQGSNTVIGCVITNAALTKAQANKLASVAHNGLARTIYPAHSSLDGDTLFTLATGRVQAGIDAVGVLAVRAVEGAVLRAVTQAKSAYGLPAACDFAKG